MGSGLLYQFRRPLSRPASTWIVRLYASLVPFAALRKDKNQLAFMLCGATWLFCQQHTDKVPVFVENSAKKIKDKHSFFTSQAAITRYLPQSKSSWMKGHPWRLDRRWVASPGQYHGLAAQLGPHRWLLTTQINTLSSEEEKKLFREKTIKQNNLILCG